MIESSVGQQVVFHEQGLANGSVIAWAKLDNPRALNSLTLDMVSLLRGQLQSWASRPEVVCVVLAGEGRAFCAGGDVRMMRDGILAGTDYCDHFFASEYQLDYAIHTFPKPVLCWGHGVVMGGGLGLLVGASHRVVTAGTRMAMPEVNIGLYPDVGASYFLNRLPEGLGLFLGITACEWNGADAVALGLADHLLDDSLSGSLGQILAGIDWTGDSGTDQEALTQTLQDLPTPAMSPALLPFVPVLAEACAGGLLSALANLPQLPIAEPWFIQAIQVLASGCPVTMRLVEEQLRRGKGMSLAEAFRQEWIMSAQCARHADFPEGVRAQLVDKDRQPVWRYTSPAAVPDGLIDKHFTNPLPAHPLAGLA